MTAVPKVAFLCLVVAATMHQGDALIWKRWPLIEFNHPLSWQGPSSLALLNDVWNDFDQVWPMTNSLINRYPSSVTVPQQQQRCRGGRVQRDSKNTQFDTEEQQLQLREDQLRKEREELKQRREDHERQEREEKQRLIFEERNSRQKMRQQQELRVREERRRLEEQRRVEKERQELKRMKEEREIRQQQEVRARELERQRLEEQRRLEREKHAARKMMEERERRRLADEEREFRRRQEQEMAERERQMRKQKETESAKRNNQHRQESRQPSMAKSQIANLNIPEGYNPKDISIETIGNHIFVKGRHECSCEENCFEREFERRISLPNNVDTRSLTASLNQDGRMHIQGVKYRQVIPPVNTVVIVEGIGLPTNQRTSDSSCKYKNAKKSGFKLKKMNPRTGEIFDDIELIEENYPLYESEVDKDGLTIEVVD